MTNFPEEKLVISGDDTQLNPLDIQQVSSSKDLFDVYRIAHDFYVSKDVLSTRPDRIWSSCPQFDLISQTTILVASYGGEVVGSISLTRDGSKGLVADTNFARTCMLIRTEEKPLAEVWRLVVAPQFPAKEKLAAALLKRATEQLASEGFQTCLLSIHPDFLLMCQSLAKSVMLASASTTFEPNSPGLFMRCSLEGVAKSVPVKQTFSKVS